jgi:protein SCO1/2
MTRIRHSRTVLAILAGCLLPYLAGTRAASASDLPDPFSEIGVEARVGTAVPGEAAFMDETGGHVRLADYLGGPPVVLAPVYFNCPNLCGSTLADLTFALCATPLSPGRDYRVLAVSIDPREGPADAATAKARALSSSAPPLLAENLHFLTGPDASITSLMQALGFRYRWDDTLQQYAHVSGIALLTPDGHLARWLPGVGLEPADLRLAMAEAGRGGIGGLTDRFLLLCYHYDPKTGRYTSLIDSTLKIAGALTVLAIAGPIGYALLRDWRPRPRDHA